MHFERHQWYSHNLGQEMALLRFGNSGKPLLVFPCSKSREDDYANHGMIEAIKPFIQSGKLQVICIDGVDEQAWENDHAHPAERGQRHEAYDRYVCEEVVPFIRNLDWRKPMVTGASMGAYHSANFFFRHPELFDGVIALSGCYKLDMFVGDYRDELVYYNSPIFYLPNLNDPRYLDLYRQSQIVFCVGQGAWEDRHIVETDEIARILAQKGIPAHVEKWGHDVEHDWPSWQVQMPHLLSQVAL